jgi:hypothetical protein
MKTILLLLSIHGWIDGYYSWNQDHPASALNFFPGVGTTAHRADKLALNVAALELVREPKPFGVHLTLVGGDSADVVHVAEPRRHPLRNVYQASLSYAAPHGLILEAGIYPSHIGFEGFFTKDNWNYTRGWLGELSPYYQSGIKASYAWSDRWSGQVHLLNGWQNVSDRNAPKAIGTQVAYNGRRFGGSFNTYADEHHRLFGDIVGTYKVTPKLTLGTSIDRGRERPANWLGLAAYGRYAITDRHAVAVRAERFRDPDGGISGTPQTLSEGTLTYEFRASSHLILKLEGRKDRFTTNQTLAIASAVIAY